MALEAGGDNGLMTTGVIILAAVAGLFWLAFRHPRPRRWLLPRRVVPRAVANVDRQHRHLQAGGLLGEAVCERTKAHIRELLEAGRADQVERELQAGLDFAVQVRALADLATPEAAGVLERQLNRALSGDPVEQSWYWADIAAGLRRLNRAEALPAVLRCADAAAGLPQGAMLAAEAVAFPNFPAAVANPRSPSGRRALRVLVAAARAGRDGVIDPAVLVRAGLGDTLAGVAGAAESVSDPWLSAAVVEGERVFRRLGHWARLLPAEVRPLAERQAMRLWAASEWRAEWLAGAAARLLDRFPAADAEEQGAALRCLFELRADVTRLVPHLPDRRTAWWADVVRALRWSASPVVGPVLAGEVGRLARKPRDHARAAAMLFALRGHPCHESEWALLRAARDAAPVVRRAAVGSLGWWPPLDPDAVVRALRVARTDPDPEVRGAAVAALARLGERAALAEVAAGLASEESAIRQQAAARIAAEGLTWLWPNLESAAEASDPDTALAACEALERLRESFLGLAG